MKNIAGKTGARGVGVLSNACAVSQRFRVQPQICKRHPQVKGANRQAVGNDGNAGLRRNPPACPRRKWELCSLSSSLRPHLDQQSSETRASPPAVAILWSLCLVFPIFTQISPASPLRKLLVQTLIVDHPPISFHQQHS